MGRPDRGRQGAVRSARVTRCVGLVQRERCRSWHAVAPLRRGPARSLAQLQDRPGRQGARWACPMARIPKPAQYAPCALGQPPRHGSKTAPKLRVPAGRRRSEGSPASGAPDSSRATTTAPNAAPMAAWAVSASQARTSHCLGSQDEQVQWSSVGNVTEAPSQSCVSLVSLVTQS